MTPEAILPPLPEGLTWYTHPNGKVVIQMTWEENGTPYREKLKLGTTPAEIAEATTLLNEVTKQLANQTFVYADHFPHQRKGAKHAK